MIDGCLGRASQGAKSGERSKTVIDAQAKAYYDKANSLLDEIDGLAAEIGRMEIRLETAAIKAQAEIDKFMKERSCNDPA